jgi:hypothetical protein
VKPTIGEVGADLAQSMTGSGLSRDGKEGSAHHFLALRPRASLFPFCVADFRPAFMPV